jgi:hypothetical protein
VAVYLYGSRTMLGRWLLLWDECEIDRVARNESIIPSWRTQLKPLASSYLILQIVVLQALRIYPWQSLCSNPR